MRNDIVDIRIASDWKKNWKEIAESLLLYPD